MIRIETNLPTDNLYFHNLRSVLVICDFTFTLAFEPSIETFINFNNVYFRCDATNGRNIVAACNALLRSLVNIRMACGKDN